MTDLFCLIGAAFAFCGALIGAVVTLYGVLAGVAFRIAAGLPTG